MGWYQRRVQGPSVYKGLYKGVGLRLRLNCSRDEDFTEAVESYSKAFALSGHNFQRARSELLKCKKINRQVYLRENKNRIYSPKKKKNIFPQKKKKKKKKKK